MLLSSHKVGFSSLALELFSWSTDLNLENLVKARTSPATLAVPLPLYSLKDQTRSPIPLPGRRRF